MTDTTYDGFMLASRNPAIANARNQAQRSVCEQSGWSFVGVALHNSTTLFYESGFDYVVMPHYIGDHITDTLGNELNISSTASNVYRKVVAQP